MRKKRMRMTNAYKFLIPWNIRSVSSISEKDLRELCRYLNSTSVYILVSIVQLTSSSRAPSCLSGWKIKDRCCNTRQSQVKPVASYYCTAMRIAYCTYRYLLLLVPITAYYSVDFTGHTRRTTVCCARKQQ